MMRRLTGLLASICLIAPNMAQAQADDMYVAVGMHLDQVMQPNDAFGLARDCVNNAICKGALVAISNATGYPIDKAAAVAAQFATNNFGEGNGFTVGLPAGYRYCSARFTLTSIVPHDGDRGSRILLRADDRGLYAETWTPVMPFGQGRSWVEGDLTVIGVRADAAEAAYAGATPCRAGNGRPFFWCRGGGCEGEVVDTGRTIDVSGDPPGAGERWQ